MDAMKRAEIIRKVIAMQHKIDASKELALEMLAHPDATPEQIATVREHLINLKLEVKQLNADLEARKLVYPITRTPVRLYVHRKP